MIWICLGLWLLGFFLLWRIPTLEDVKDDNNPVSLSIIIPARNEQDNLEILLSSLKGGDTDQFELIVVDDDSSDATRTVAESHGVKVIQAPKLPDDWRGKTWACHQGAAVAHGDWLLFLDADLTFQKGGLHKVLGFCRSRKAEVLSLGPFHEIKKPYECLSAIFNLLTFMGMGAFSPLGSPVKPKALFGPFFLISRTLYFEIRGHESVKQEILEHMSLYRILHEKKAPMLCLGGKDTVHTRMYPHGLASLVEGWSKAFASGAAKTATSILLVSVAWITGGVLAGVGSAISLFSSAVPPLMFLSYGAYAAQLFFMLRQVGQFSVWYSIFHPVLFLGFIFVFTRSLILKISGKTIHWKGRSIKAIHQ